MILPLIIILTFLSVFILSLLVFIIPSVEKKQVNKSLDQISTYSSNYGNISTSQDQSHSQLGLPVQSFGSRVIYPFLIKLSSLARKFTPLGMVDYLKRQLVLAGNPNDLNVDKFLALKALFSIALLGIIVLLALISFAPRSRLIIFAFIVVPLSFFAPDLWLKSQVDRRQKEIGLSLPDTLDLLSISVEAGLGFDAALTKVIKNSKGPLAQEFSKMLSECQVGMSRKDALKNLAGRSTVPDLHSFVTSMIQADVLGVSISKVLRTKAQEMRLKRRQKAEEIAQKAPVKIVFPLIFCIFPSLMIVILGPAAIQIYYALAGLVNR